MASSKSIFYLAGWAGEPSIDARALGASKKIRYFLKILHALGHKVVLIYTAPPMTSSRSVQDDFLSLDENLLIPRITVPRHKFGKFGRLRSIGDAEIVLNHAIATYGPPDIVWCYNAYAFEMHAARIAHARLGCSIIVQLEDAIFARWRLNNIKPLVDFFFFKRVACSIVFATCVNSHLKEVLRRYNISAMVVPGIVTSKTLCLPTCSLQGLAPIKVGYFGGLSIDKGADFLFKLIKQSIKAKSPLEFHITGSGGLSRQFLELSTKFPHSIHYHGVVSEDEYSSLLGSIDVILNPHQNIPGVFPFKLIEAVAAGKLVVSSPLSYEERKNKWLLSAIKQIDLEVEKWHEFLLSVRQWPIVNEDHLQQARQVIANKYTPEAIANSLQRHIVNL